MWQGKIQLIIGIWLILSGVVTLFQHPGNMLVIGFLLALCCFSSFKIWQAALVGVLGLWLFLCGLHDWMGISGKIMVSQLNFIFSGVLLSFAQPWRQLQIRFFCEHN